MRQGATIRGCTVPHRGSAGPTTLFGTTMDIQLGLVSGR